MTGATPGLSLPPSQDESLFRGAISVCRDLWQWRHLVRAFVLYDIKHDKRNNVLGNIWHLLNPVFNMLIFLFVFKVIFKGREENYALTFFCGAMFFRLWTISFGKGVAALTQQAGMIKSCYFPRIVVIAPITLTILYGFIVESLVLVALLAFFRVMPGWEIVLAIPFTAVTLVGTTGAVLFLSCLGVRFRDLSSIIQHVNRLFFYFTPVMYPLSFVPEKFRDLYMLNPVSCAVEMARDLIIRAQLPPLGMTVYYTLFCFSMFAIGLLVFTALQKRIAKFL